MALTQQAIPLDAFRGAEVVPARGRYEVRLPGSARPEQAVDLVNGVREAPKSKGMEWLLERWREHGQQVLWEARENNRQKSSDWDLWLDQKEGLLPEKGVGMISQVGHNMTLEVYSSSHTNIDEIVFGNGFFEYDPPGNDRTDIGLRIASALQAIARAQIQTPEFEQERYRFIDADLTFGYALGTFEYEKSFQPRMNNGVYTEELVDNGNVFRNVMPYHCGFRRWDEPDWQRQGAIVYEHELTIPMIVSEHMAAVVGDLEIDENGNPVGGLVYPSGWYFNLAELWDKVKDLTTPGERSSPRDSVYHRYKTTSTDDVDTSIKKVLAYTVWTQDIDMPRLIAKAIDKGASQEEIFLTTGITPDQVENCRRWKLTCVDTTGGKDWGSEPDTVIQMRANPYKHGEFPIVASQCIPFIDRAMGIGYGEIMYYIQLAMNTLLTLNVDNAIRDSVDMFLVQKDVIAGLEGSDSIPIDQGLFFEWDPNAGGGVKDAKSVIQRFGPGSDVRSAWPEAASMLDRLYAIMQRTSGQKQPPFGGRKTATEIAEIAKSNMQSLTAVVAGQKRRAFHKLAIQQAENNAQFMEPETALRLAGKAGLNLEFVSEAQQQLDGTITKYPVDVRVIGKRRMVDRVTQGQIMQTMEQSPVFQAHVMARLQNARLPKDLENFLLDKMDMMGLEHLDRYLPQDDRMQVQQVRAMLMQGMPVEFDATRFQTPQDFITEIAAVRDMAEEGSYLAAEYLDKLQRRFREMLGQMAAAQQAGSMQGAGGGGSRAGQAGAAPMLPMMGSGGGLPPYAMNEVQANVTNSVGPQANVIVSEV